MSSTGEIVCVCERERACVYVRERETIENHSEC